MILFNLTSETAFKLECVCDVVFVSLRVECYFSYVFFLFFLLDLIPRPVFFSTIKYFHYLNCCLFSIYFCQVNLFLLKDFSFNAHHGLKSFDYSYLQLKLFNYIYF